MFIQKVNIGILKHFHRFKSLGMEICAELENFKPKVWSFLTQRRFQKGKWLKAYLFWTRRTSVESFSLTALHIYALVSSQASKYILSSFALDKILEHVNL